MLSRAGESEDRNTEADVISRLEWERNLVRCGDIAGPIRRPLEVCWERSISSDRIVVVVVFIVVPVVQRLVL